MAKDDKLLNERRDGSKDESREDESKKTGAGRLEQCSQSAKVRRGK